MRTDDDLYLRGATTLIASWEEYARGAEGAAVHRGRGVAAAVFPHEPEHGVYNNALLDRGLAQRDRSAALDAMEAVYTEAGLTRFAAWAHESDEPMRADLEQRGYGIAEYTLAMGMCLDHARVPTAPVTADVELGSAEWMDYVRFLPAFGTPSGLLSGTDPHAFRVRTARVGGETVAAAISIDVDGDCGIFNVGTVESARRQGLATALTALLVRDALERGCRTASLQSTEMGEQLYSALGFRALGRILEYAL